MSATTGGPVTLAVTMGDPKGIGPEILLKALQSPGLPERTRLLVVGSSAVLQSEAQSLGLPCEMESVNTADEWTVAGPAILDLDNFPPDALRPAIADAESGRASLDYIQKSVALALIGAVDGVVTCPINKEAIAAAGSPFPGHTEMLTALTHATQSVMLLVARNLRVALATKHIALRDVPGRLSAEIIVETGKVLAQGLRRFFSIPDPVIAVCGLNPHSGDGGRFGDEEARIVTPAVEEIRRAEIQAQGPKPADTVFSQAAAGHYDAVIALYHDQGMIPVKLHGLGDVVNVTLGLPIVRASVGHGTAYDIAGRGVADERSLVSAISLAADMALTARSAR